ncbi:MAG TPA: winged helix-turn-helix domain-containing protein [Vicinamibacterales bacterium]|nr:winged helix-turn-helix domain-containing protein [Vicinamibacterales bacterium]
MALTPKASDLLKVLVASGDRVIEKQELMQLVWPDSVVTDDSLTQHIGALRKALGDAPDRPGYILTVPQMAIDLSRRFGRCGTRVTSRRLPGPIRRWRRHRSAVGSEPPATQSTRTWLSDIGWRGSGQVHGSPRWA